MAFEDSLIGSDDFDPRAATEALIRQTTTEPLPEVLDPRMLNTRLARKLAQPGQTPAPSPVEAPSDPATAEPAAAPDFSGQAVEPAASINKEADFSAQAAEPPMIGPTAPVAQPTSTLGQYPVEFGKGVLEGGKNMGASALKGAAAVSIPTAADPKFLDELASAKEMKPSQLAKLQGRVLREVSDRGLQMDYIAALRRISQGGDAAKEVETLRPKFLANNVSATTPVTEKPLYKAGQAVEDFGKETLKAAPGFEGSWTRDIGSGAGSMAAGIAASMIPSIGPTLAGTIFTAAGAGEATDRAVKGGADNDTIRRAAMLGGAAGATDLVDALLPMLGSTGKALGFVKRVGIAAVKGAIMEGGQEGVQQLMQNAISKGLYKPDQDLFEDVPRSVAIAAILGGAGGGISGAASRGRADQAPGLAPPPGGGAQPGAGPTSPDEGPSSPEDIADFVRRAREGAPPPEQPDSGPSASSGPDPASMSEAERMHAYTASRESHGGASEADILKAAGLDPATMDEQDRIDAVIRATKRQDTGSNAGAERPASGPDEAPKAEDTSEASHLRYAVLREYGYSDEDIDNMPATQRAKEFKAAIDDGIKPGAAMGKHPKRAKPKPAETETETSFAPTTESDVGADAQSTGLRTFTTAKGSTYQVHEDGTTTRNKAARTDPGHEGDQGPKERSAKTVYLDQNATSRLSIPQEARWRVIDHGDGTMSLATWNEQAKDWGIAPSARNIKVSDQPAVGLHPVEVWKPEKIKGLTGYKGLHFGNAITAMGEAPAKGDGTRKAPIDIKSAEDVAAAAKPATGDYTHAQGEANNRQLGHGKWNDLPIRIEVAKGGTRKMLNPNTGEGVDVTHDGAAYGYFPGTVGADKMAVDLYLGENPDSPNVFVIDEIDRDTRKFRQHKVMGGFQTEQEAFSAYVQTSTKGPETVGAITSMSVPELKTWLAGDTTKALKFAEQASPAPKKTKPAARTNDDPLSLLQFIAHNGGLAPHPELDALDIGDRRVQIPGRKGFFGIIRPTGMSLDNMREAAEEAGYFRGENNKTSTIRDLLDAMDVELRGGQHRAEGDEGKATKKQRTSFEESNAAARDKAITDNVEAIREEYGAELPEGLAEQAATIMADEMLDLDSAVEMAAVRAVNEDADYDGITENDIVATYGEGVFDEIQARQPSEDGGTVAPTVEEDERPGEGEEAVEDGSPDEGARAEGGEADALTKYAESIIGAEVKSVHLVGSVARNGKGKDIDLLYDLGERDLPADSSQAADQIESIVERTDIDLDAYDTFLKSGDRYFHVATGAGRTIVENTSYAADQAGKPVKLLAAAEGGEAGPVDENGTPLAVGDRVTANTVGGQDFEGTITRFVKNFPDGVPAAEIRSTSMQPDKKGKLKEYAGLSIHALDKIAKVVDREQVAEPNGKGGFRAVFRPKEEQVSIPGTEAIGQGEQAQRKANEPLKPKVAQNPADEGLFGDAMNQRDLLDMPPLDAIEAALGEDADKVAPVDIARAAEIMADNPGMDAGTAFGQAVAVGTVEQGFFTEQQAEEAYGPEIQDVLEAARASAPVSGVDAAVAVDQPNEVGGGDAAQDGVVPSGGETVSAEADQTAQDQQLDDAAGAEPDAGREAGGVADEQGADAAEAADQPELTPEQWWKELTVFGRKDVMEQAGINRPARVLWKYLSADEQSRLIEFMGANDGQEGPSTDLRQPQARDARDAGIRGLEVDESAVPGSGAGAGVLRGSDGLSGMAGQLPGVSAGYGAEAESGAYDRAPARERGISPGQLRMGDENGAVSESARLRDSADLSGQDATRRGVGGRAGDQGENTLPATADRLVGGENARDSATDVGGDRGIQIKLPTGDAIAGAEDVQPAQPGGDADGVRGREGGGSEQAVPRADGERAEDAGRVSKGARGKRGNRAGDGGDARLSEPRADDAADGRAKRNAQRAADTVGENHVIEPGSLDEGRGQKAKARDNIKAIETMQRLEAEGRPATAAEQADLARYVGWGGIKNIFPDESGNYGDGFQELGPKLRGLLTDEEYATARRSIQYAHYTAEDVVRSMWDAVVKMGFNGGQVFEPGMGVGNFAGMMPQDVATNTHYQGVELDHVTARIAKLLYPKYGVRQDDFTKTKLPENSYDLVIGNPPFADVAIKSDPKYKQGFLLHDYFFAKSLDAVRPGGLLAFVTSAGTMNKMDPAAREYLADRADLVGAIRLPGDAFMKNAGTMVTTDIIFLRKRLPGDVPGDRSWTETKVVSLPGKEGMVEGNVNRYLSEHPEMVLGKPDFNDRLYPGRYSVKSMPGSDIRSDLQRAIEKLPANVMSPWQDVNAESVQHDFDTTEKKEGTYYVGPDGALHQVVSGVGQKVGQRGKGVENGRTAADMERIKGLVPIRDALRAVYAADLKGDTANAERARAALNKTYDTFVNEFGPINKAVLQTRRPNVIQMENARQEAREEARYAGEVFREGTFDATKLLEEKTPLSVIARKRQEARDEAAKAGLTFDEGAFDPDEVPDVIIDKRPNVDPFMDDPESYRLRAIETYDEGTGQGKKSDVFFKNIITREVTPKISSVNDGLLYSLSQYGRVNIPAIAELTKKTDAEVIEALGEQVFKVPGTKDTFVTRDEYLSGNVRKKLELAQRAADRNPEFRRNVAALEANQPVPLAPSQIHASLGMPWIPPAVIEKYAKEELGLDAIRVRYTSALASWTVSGDTDSVAARSTWGTEDRRAPALLQDALNRQTTKIYDTIYVDGKKSQSLNVAKTEAANDKLTQMKEKFSGWIWNDQERSDTLAAYYNENYNNLVVREYNGDYLTTPGIASDWSWRPHQKRVIARIIQSGNTYVAHAVGAGKTSEYIGAIMEMRRLGLVRKPMVAVPNHMLAQFTKEWYHQYPTARLAIADDKRFHNDRRKQFVANVAMEDLDAIIITHSSFGMIPVSDEFQNNIINREISQYREVLGDLKNQGGDTRITRSRIEKQIERLEQRLVSRKGRKDATFTFEEMGVDHLTIDEAHLFRKLDFSTAMSNLKGVSPEGSQMAWDLYVKSLYLDTIRPGRGLVLGSGTPITNTMAELYTLSRYMQPAVLAERGLEKFDAWAGAFGESVSELEQDAAGNYKPVSRFAKFVNVAELSAMARQVMDVVTGKQLEQYVPRPQLKGGKRQFHLAEKTREQARFLESLAGRMKVIQERKGPPQKGDDIMLSVINDGRHAAIDLRLAGGDASSEPSKLDLMVDNVFRIWSESKRQPFHKIGKDGKYEAKPTTTGPATQLVFVNLGLSGARGFSVPDYIRAELTRRGVPKNEVAYIYDYKSATAKQRLFNDMNEGKVRILIGSVAKMGVGTNVQKRLLATHNMDPLWYPADDEQRVGRIIRQGNMNPEVQVHDYSTKGTYDSTMWGMMEKKARFIQGFFEGDPSLRDMDDLGEASQYEQAKALTTSDPRLIRFTELKQELERATRRKSAFDSDVYTTRQNRQKAKSQIEHYAQRVEDTKKDISQRIDTRGDKFSGKVGKETFDKRADFGVALFERLAVLEDTGSLQGGVKVATVGGFDVYATVKKSNLIKDQTNVDVFMALNGNATREVSYDTSSLGTVRSIEHTLHGFESDLVEYEQRFAKAAKFFKDSETKANAKFEGQAEIDALKKQVDDLAAELAKKPADIADAPVAEDYSLPEDFTLVEPGQPDPNGLPIDAEGLRRWRIYSPGGFAIGLGNTKAEAFAHYRKWDADNSGAEIAQLSDMQATLTPAADEAAENISRMLTAIVRAVAGDMPEIKFHKGLIPLKTTIGYPAGMEPKAAGLYHLGTSALQLALTKNAEQMAGSAFHESYHHIEDKLQTPAEREFMKAETPRMRAFIKGKTKLTDEQVDGLAGFEVRAIAFQLYASARVDAKIKQGFHIGVRRWFERLLDFLARVRNGLKGLGFNTYSDVFSDAFEGKFAKRPRQETNGIDPAELAALSDIWGAVADRVGSKIDLTELRTQVQDKFIRVRHAQDSVGGVPTSQNAYQAEALYYGRTGEQLEQLEKNHFDPLVKDMKARGITLAEINDYLYAKHAPERNRAMDAINHPDLDPDGRDLRGRGSGMSDEEAQTIMDGIDAAGRMNDFVAIEGRVRQIQENTRQGLVDSGLISQETADAWAGAYDHYVPLQGFEEGTEDEALTGKGQGYDTRAGESKRAFGRLSKAAGPLPYVMMQAEMAIVRGEKNKVGNTFLRFVRSHPDPRRWSINTAPTKKAIDPRTGLVTRVADTNYIHKPDVFVTKIGGVPMVIQMHNREGQNLARALKNMGTSNLNAVLRFAHTLTTFMARLATQYNPNFLIPNFARDVGEAFINLQAQDQARFVRQFSKHLFPAIKGSFDALRGATGGQYAAAFREFDAAGGRIRFFGLENPDDVKANVEKKLRRLDGGMVNNLIAAGEAAANGMEVVSGSIENATRLAAYMAARDVGMSIPDAANLALNLTVNFTRKGEIGGAINALYMFANAAIQGTVRVAQALHHPRVRKAAYSLVGIGALAALFSILAGGDDDDGTPYYTKIKPYVRDKNLIIMWPKGMGHDGQYLKIPLPYAFSPFFVLGARLVGVALGKEKPTTAMMAVLNSIAEAVNPLGEESGMPFAVMSLLPSVTRPAAHITTNQNWTGNPLYPTRDYDKNKPDSEQSFRSNSEFSKTAAREINKLGGGSPYKSSGWLDWHPGSIDHALESLTGGLGKFIGDTAKTASAIYNGDPFDATKAPVLRRFVGSAKDPLTDAGAYYEAREEARKNGGDAIRNAQRDRAKGVNKEDAESFLRNNQNSIRGEQVFKTADDAMKPLRAQRERIEADTAMDREAKRKAIEDVTEKMRQIQNTARKKYQELKQGAAK